jgi:hypothetical protein
MWGPLNKGCERRTWALPDASGGGDRFGVVVGEGVVEPRIEGRFARCPLGHQRLSIGTVRTLAPLNLRQTLRGAPHGIRPDVGISLAHGSALMTRNCPNNAVRNTGIFEKRNGRMPQAVKTQA